MRGGGQMSTEKLVIGEKGAGPIKKTVTRNP